METKTIKVGAPYDDLPLDVAAGKIIAQLARRNILVMDVDCWEYTKKKLNVKIVEDGITIKHKKFSFDDGAVVTVPEETNGEAEAPQGQIAQLLALLQSNPQILQQLGPQGCPSGPPGVQGVPGIPSPPQSRALVDNNGKRVLRYEIFEPELPNMLEAKKQGYKFTLGRKYPIYSERMTGIPPVTSTLYVVGDDTGAQVEVSAKFFAAPIQGKLAFEDEMVGGPDISAGPEPKLMWGNAGDDDGLGMPALR